MKSILRGVTAAVLVCGAATGGDLFILEKADRFDSKMVVDGFLYVDAEDFDDYGGWRMDTQFVHLMGSSFMMATGIGTPVADATTTINVPKAGEYHVWVRARNWVKDHCPGRFQVVVNGAGGHQPGWRESGIIEEAWWTRRGIIDW